MSFTGLQERDRLHQEALARGEIAPEPAQPEPKEQGLEARRDPKDIPLNATGKLIYQLADDLIQQEYQKDQPQS